jgi:hypothetical protein
VKQGLAVVTNKHHKDWFVPGLGFVKAESYRPNAEYKSGDKPFFWSELVSFQKN